MTGEDILPVAFIVLVVLGFVIRAAIHFRTEQRQKEEIITVLKEIRDALKKS